MPSMVFQWFLILLPSLSMVFDGSGPLVKRCDGFDGSLWSKCDAQLHSLALPKYKREKMRKSIPRFLRGRLGPFVDNLHLHQASRKYSQYKAMQNLNSTTQVAKICKKMRKWILRFLCGCLRQGSQLQLSAFLSDQEFYQIFSNFSR